MIWQETGILSSTSQLPEWQPSAVSAYLPSFLSLTFCGKTKELTLATSMLQQLLSSINTLKDTK